MNKWIQEKHDRNRVRYLRPIRFGASIMLPASGKFLFERDYLDDPERFLKAWLEGATSTIYTGPLYNKSGCASGELLELPLVRVRNAPWLLGSLH